MTGQQLWVAHPISHVDELEFPDVVADTLAAMHSRLAELVSEDMAEQISRVPRWQWGYVAIESSSVVDLAFRDSMAMTRANKRLLTIATERPRLRILKTTERSPEQAFRQFQYLRRITRRPTRSTR